VCCGIHHLLLSPQHAADDKKAAGKDPRLGPYADLVRTRRVTASLTPDEFVIDPAP
jgi:hypothetical protein